MPKSVDAMAKLDVWLPEGAPERVALFIKQHEKKLSTPKEETNDYNVDHSE